MTFPDQIVYLACDVVFWLEDHPKAAILTLTGLVVGFGLAL